MSFEDARGNPDPTAPTRWVGTPELMAHLGIVSKNTVTNYVKAGMPVHQPLKGGRYLFDLVEVDEWIRSRWTASVPRQTA